MTSKLWENTLVAIIAVIIGACAGSYVAATAQSPGVQVQQCATHYPVTVRRVVDADTIDVEVDLGLEVFVRTRLRLAGIDAWEVRGEERPRGLVATEFAREWLEASEALEIRPEDTRGFRKGKYGRWVAFLCRPRDVCLNDLLVTEGHAERSDG